MSEREQFNALRSRILAPEPFSEPGLVMDLFRFQASYNPLYARFLDLLGVRPLAVSDPSGIPFFPIQLFRQYAIRTGNWKPQVVFQSSGTTGSVPSRHELRDLGWYLQNAERGFERYYGPLEGMAILALLPAYLERPDSSLVCMARHFIERSARPESGFFLNDLSALEQRLSVLEDNGVPTLLLGVSFALLDLAETGNSRLQRTIVMETGGMKGRRKEITRNELHLRLKEAFGIAKVHSEYGMTELLSQAWSDGEGIFRPSPTMRVSTREITDPLSHRPAGKTGALNIIDLANLDTLSFIATEDVGKVRPDGAFEVLGRLDSGDIRGCNLMVE